MARAELVVGVRADTDKAARRVSTLSGRVRGAAAKASKAAEITYHTKLDAAQLRAEAATAAAKAKASVTFDAEFAKIDKLKSEAERAARLAKAKVKFEASIEAADVRVKASLAAAKAKAKVEYDAAISSAVVKAKAAIAAAKARSAVAFEPEIDVIELYADVKAAAVTAEKFAKIKFTLDRKGFKQDVDGVWRSASGAMAGASEMAEALAENIGQASRQASKAGGTMSKLGGAIGPVAVAAASAAPAIAAMGASLFAILSVVAYASASLLTLPAILGAIGLGAAAVIVGSRGMGTAFKAQAKAQQELASTGRVSVATQKALDASMKSLAPSARSTVTAILGVKDAFSGMGKAVQQRLFAGLAPQITKAGTTLRSILGPALERAADLVNTLAKRFLGFVSSAKGSQQIKRILDGLLDVLGGLGNALSDFGAGIVNLFEQSIPGAKKLTGGIEGIAKSFRKWTEDTDNAGKFTGFLKDAVDQLGKVLDLGKQVGRIIGNLFKGSNESGKGLVDSLTESAEKLADFLGSAEGQEKINQFFKDAADLVREMATAFKEIMPPILKVTGAVITVQSWVSGFWNTVGDVGGKLAGLTSLVGLFGKIGPAVSAALGWIAGIGRTVGTAFATAAVAVAGWVAGLPRAFAGLAGKVFSAAGSIAAGFGRWVASLPGAAVRAATWVVTGFRGLAGRVIGGAGSLASRFAGWISTLPGAATRLAGRVVSSFRGLAGRVIGGAGSLATRFAGWVGSLPGKARTAVTGAVGAFRGLAGRAVEAAGSLATKARKFVTDMAGAGKDAAQALVDKFKGLAGKIISAIGDIVPKIKMPKIPRPKIPNPFRLGRSAPAVPAPRSGLLTLSDDAMRAGRAREADTVTTTAAPLVININGALDPEAVARQVKRLLGGHAVRIGTAGLRTA